LGVERAAAVRKIAVRCTYLHQHTLMFQVYASGLAIMANPEQLKDLCFKKSQLKDLCFQFSYKG